MTDLNERFEKLTPLQKAMVALKESQAQLEQLRGRMNEPIAVVGAGCRLPGGVDDPTSFWKLLDEGRDAVTEVPAERWSWEAVYDSDPTAPGKTTCRRGGFLSDIQGFDPQFFGVSEREALRMDPQHRLLMELAVETFEDAGVPLSKIAGSKTGVWIGLATGEYVSLMQDDPRRVDPFLATGTSLCMAANRLSYAFDLHGPSLQLDTACSASLLAIHMACQSLRSGECEAALAGGVNLLLTPLGMVSLTKAGFASVGGRCRSFDAKADGYVRSEGGGLVLLKTLSAAQRDGDRIYAIIRGSAAGQDGRRNGLTAPNGPAQTAVVRQAAKNAGVELNTLGYVEAQGTGTRMGDTVEARALGEALGPNRDRRCLIGSVKTNVGHLETAAGVAGLLKSALALEHGTIPASLHFESPNPQIDLDALGLEVASQAQAWPTASPRRAGVSAFGFGGTNVHVVLEEAPAVRPTAPRSNQRRLTVVSARSEAALKAMAGRLAQYVETSSDLTLDDLTYSLAQRRDHHDVRFALAVDSLADFAQALKQFAAGETPAGASTGRRPAGRDPQIYFLFPGCLKGWHALARTLRAEPRFAQALADWNARLKAAGTNVDLLGWLDRDEQLPSGPTAESLLLALQMATVETLKSFGVAPIGAVGVGSGEAAAAVVSGVAPAETFLRRAHADPDEHINGFQRPALSLILGRSNGFERVRRFDPLEKDAATSASAGSLIAEFERTSATQPPPEMILEIGPGTLSAQLKREAAGPLPGAAILDLAAPASTAPFTTPLARIYAAGANLEWPAIQGDAGRFVRFPKYPWQRKPYWIDAGRSISPEQPIVGATPEARPRANEQPELRPRPELNAPYTAPRTALERYVASMWGAALGLEGVGIDDNFFELGGDSLRGMTLLNRLQIELREVVQPTAMFECQTVRDLVLYLKRQYPDTIAKMYPDEPLVEVVEAAELTEWEGRIDERALTLAKRLSAAHVTRPQARPISGPKNPRAVFVLAPPRSGTTLLRVMLAGHPKLFSPQELELLSFNTMVERRDAYPGQAVHFIEGAIATLMEVQGCSNEEAKTLIARYEDEGMTIAQFYRRLQDAIGDRLLVDKTPAYAGNPEALKRAEYIFDEPFYIQLLRHPCGMVQSYVDYKLYETYSQRFNTEEKSPFSPRQMAEMVWINSNRNMVDFLKQIPPHRQFKLRYEDVVRDPEGTMRPLCEALGIGYDPEVTKPYDNQEKKMLGAINENKRMHGDQRFLVKHRSIDPSVADRWKEKMSADALGDVARRMAREFGYLDVPEPAGRPVPAPALPPVVDPQTLLAMVNELSPTSSMANSAPPTLDPQALLAQINDLSASDVDSLLRQLSGAGEGPND